MKKRSGARKYKCRLCGVYKLGHNCTAASTAEEGLGDHDTTLDFSITVQPMPFESYRTPAPTAAPPVVLPLAPFQSYTPTAALPVARLPVPFHSYTPTAALPVASPPAPFQSYGEGVPLPAGILDPTKAADIFIDGID